MPRGDGTGPVGAGPQTGRGLGFCSGFDRPGFMQAMPGRGWHRGRGLGMGRGFRRGYRCFGPGFGSGFGPGPFYYGGQPAAMNPEQEKNMLQAEAQQLRNALSNIEQRIQEISE